MPERTKQEEALANLAEVIHRFLHYYRPSIPGSPLKPHEIGMVIHIQRYRRLRGKWPGPSAISEVMQVSRPAITATLNSLERQGYLCRILSPVDRRRFTVELTPLGQKLAQAAAREFCQTTQRIMTALGEEDSEKFQELLEKVILAMEHEKGAKG